MIATLLLLASLLGAGPAPSQPVATPIAVGHRYQLPATTAVTSRAVALGTLACRRATRVLRMAHVELFVRGRAVLLPAGIGIAPPAAVSGGQVLGGRCRYPLSTADPTGVISVNQPGRRTLGQLARRVPARLGRCSRCRRSSCHRARLRPIRLPPWLHGRRLGRRAGSQRRGTASAGLVDGHGRDG